MPKHRMLQVGDTVKFFYDGGTDKWMEVRILEIIKGEGFKAEDANDVWNFRPVFGLISETGPL